MQRNFMNTNDVFPILDLIRRQMKKEPAFFDFDGMDSDEGGQSGGYISLNEIEEMTVERDETNKFDPTVASKIVIVYVSGAVETLTINRGLDDVTIPKNDPEYMYKKYGIMDSIDIDISYEGSHILATVKIERDNGLFKKLTYDWK